MARVRELTLPRNNRGLLILAVVSGLIAAVLVAVVLAQSGGNDGGGIGSGTLPAVVARADIPAGGEITADNVKIIDVPVGLLLQGAFTTTEKLLGETARYPIAAGEQLTQAKVGPQVNDDALAFVVPQGMRAVAVKVDEISGVGGLLVAGDRVDVIAVFDRDDVDADKAVTILQSVEVLSVAQEAQEPVAGSAGTDRQGSTSGQRPSDRDPQPDARTVTLAVTAEQAQLLALVQEYGKIWLSLRAFGDEAPVSIPQLPLTIFGVPRD